MGILIQIFQRSTIIFVNLILYYQDVDRWGFTFQIYAYQSRLMAWDRQLQQLLKNNQQSKEPVLVFTERSIESARELFFKLCYNDGNISQIEYEIYEEFYQWLMNHYPQYLIDCVIYVNTPPEICLERLIKRGRSEEVSVPLDYLKKLHQRHEDWLSQKSNRFQTIKIDATLNYVQDQKIKENVRQLLVLEIQRLQKLLN
ncbi:unnamed protein product [Paramecium primaurelia]|uniref:Deoxynucleoside kinase domain-containing protein n=1 Tax=Paramecium primaurelia TaxID=5886 RepID=A0A8S1N8H5_PARPR|nr:unnamed protein product [Paramecium primaurelia]